MQFLFVFILLLSGALGAQTKEEAEIARSTYAEKIYRETVPAQKAKLYKRWLKKFPPSDFINSLALYDFTRAEIAKAYIRQKNLKKAIILINGIVVDEVKPEIWFSIGNSFFDNGYREEAEQFLKMAWEKTYEYVLSKKLDPASSAVISRFPEYSIRLSDLFNRPGKEKQALGYIKPAFDRSDGLIDDLNNRYITLLVATGFDSLGTSTGEDLVAAGVTDHELRNLLFSISFRIKGIDSAKVQAQRLGAMAFEKRKTLLSKEMIDKTAPAFTLSDLSGKKVSLSDFRGKTVVLDFWATWCIPCIQSFPYLKRVVDSYKDDSLVKFLFIHTWEKDNDPLRKAKKLMEDYKYDFHVLMDIKDPVTEVNQVVEDYTIEALPAKAIIDKNGRIRILKIANWKKESSDGNAMEELTAMIELVRNLAP